MSITDRFEVMTTLLIGADGQLGSELRQLFDEGDLVPLTHADLELTNPGQVREILSKYRPSLILNTAAYHRVDECEEFPERAFTVNAIAIRDLVIAAKEIGAILVHVSTGYVFDGSQRYPYREVDRRDIPRAEKRFLPIQWNVWMNATMDVSIVIRSKDEERFIGEVLEGLFGQEFGGSFEVVILDSGSQDGTLEVARRFPVTFYSMSPEEFTFGRARNRGARIAKGEYIIYLSAHCTPVDQGWLIRLLQSIALKWSRNLARQEYRYCRDNGYDYRIPLISLFWALRIFFFWRGLMMGRLRYGWC